MREKIVEHWARANDGDNCEALVEWGVRGYMHVTQCSRPKRITVRRMMLCWQHAKMVRDGKRVTVREWERRKKRKKKLA